ncbi:MAG: DUF3047 domain-containing protein [Rhodoferax sp.]
MLPSVEFMRSWLQLVCGVLVLTGCASTVSDVQRDRAVVRSQLPLSFSAQEQLQWEAVDIPGKLRTAFRLDQHQGRASLRADSERSASMLRQKLHIAPDQLQRLSFEWHVENLIPEADMTQRETEDSPVRLILAFEGDRQTFSAKNAMLSELSRALTGEEMPYATLMYVWSNQQPVDSVIINPRSDRIRKIVVETGPAHLKQWRRYERHIRVDFEKAFGEPPGALMGLAIMTDTDNTQSKARAWYGDIRLD